MESPQLLQHKKPNNYVEGDSMYVEGALKMVLRWCRGFGIAPIITRRDSGGSTGAGWHAVLSPQLATLQAIVMTLFNIAAVVGVLLDLNQMPEKRIRAGDSFVKTFIWIADLALMMLIASDAVYSGPAQMQCLQRVFVQMQQIKLDLSMSPSSSRTEKIKSIAIFSWIIFVAFVAIVDFVSFVRKSDQKDAIWSIMPLYSLFYVANVQEALVVMRWSLTVQALSSAAAAVNLHLQWILQANLKPEPILDHQDVGVTRSQTLEDFIKRTKTSTKSIKMGSEYSTYPSQVQVIIRRLALSHERISEIIRQTNDTQGLVLMAVLMSTFLRLVLTPYYAFAQLFRDRQLAAFDMLPFGWGVILIAKLILTIEPCHSTHVQRKRTGIILSQLIVHTAPKCHSVSNELDQFAKQIVLSDDKFMPLGVYVLSRPLIATMLGSVTTYLLILVQFEAVSNHL